jgi:hypothetical protein
MLLCYRVKLVEGISTRLRSEITSIPSTNLGKLAVREHAALSIESLKDTIALSVLLNEFGVEPLCKSVNPALGGVVDPRGSNVDSAFASFDRLTPSFSSDTVASFKDNAAVAFADHVVGSGKTSESGSNDDHIDRLGWSSQRWCDL